MPKKKLITDKDVIKVAKMSKLASDPSDEFVSKYIEEFSAILEKVDEMQGADVDGIDVLANSKSLDIESLRDDNPSDNQDLKSKVRSNIISNFSSSQGGLLIVPGIFS